MMWTKSALLFFFTKSVHFAGAKDSAFVAQDYGFDTSMVNRLQPYEQSDGSDADAFIIGGTNADRGEYPYYTHMKIETPGGTFSCGGSLIAPDVVLSAAHCNDPFSDSNVESGYVGATRFWSVRRGAELRSCTQWINHPLFVPEQLTPGGFIVDGTTVLGGNDFALCKLDRPVDIDTSSVYLEMNEDSNFPPSDTVTESMGMGRISPDGSQGTNVLKRTDLPYLDDFICRIIYGGTFKDDTMLCTLDLTTGVCSGDSGGPIVVASRDPDGRIKHKQVGVVSWGSGDCGPPFPDVHARVSGGMDWIKTTVCGTFGSNATFCGADNSCDDAVGPIEFRFKGRKRTLRCAPDLADYIAAKGPKKGRRACNLPLFDGSGFVRDECAATCATVDVGPCVL